jgi:hypothetical protein
MSAQPLQKIAGRINGDSLYDPYFKLIALVL